MQRDDLLLIGSDLSNLTSMRHCNLSPKIKWKLFTTRPNITLRYEYSAAINVHARKFRSPGFVRVNNTPRSRSSNRNHDAREIHFYRRAARLCLPRGESHRRACVQKCMINDGPSSIDASRNTRRRRSRGEERTRGKKDQSRDGAQSSGQLAP